jgi:hypothetical protein
MLASPAQSASRAILEDVTGRRGRWMRRLGRTLSVLLVAWLFVLLVGGLGLTPVAGVPFADFLRPSEGPTELAAPPKPRKPTADDLRPARPLPEPVVTSPSEALSVSEPEPATPVSRGGDVRRSTPQPSASRRSAHAQTRAAPSRRAATPPAVKTTPVARPTPSPRTPIANPTPAPATTPPAPQAATPTPTPPSQSATPPGNSGQAPGHTRTTPPATTATPPAQTETPPGRSETAPGQVRKAATTTTTTAPAPPPPPAPESSAPVDKPPKPPK